MEATTVSQADYAALRQQNAALRHELDQLKRLLFGAKSERFIPTTPPEQMALWEEPKTETAAAMASVSAAAPEQQISYLRRRAAAKKAHPGRAGLPAHLPVEEIVLEPVGQDIAGLECIGRDITETLDYRPGRLVIIRRIRPKYARPAAAADGSTEVLVAELPSRPIDKSLAEPGLLAELCVAKYVDHLPFYRQIWALCPRLPLGGKRLDRQRLVRGHLRPTRTPLPGATTRRHRYRHRLPTGG